MAGAFPNVVFFAAAFMFSAQVTCVRQVVELEALAADNVTAAVSTASDSCGELVAGAIRRKSKGFPECKCGVGGEKVFCGDEMVGERKFDATQVRAKCSSGGAYCATKAQSGFVCGMLQSRSDACRPESTGLIKTTAACSTKCSGGTWLGGTTTYCQCSTKGENCATSDTFSGLKYMAMGAVGSVRVDARSGAWWYESRGHWAEVPNGFMRASTVTTPSSHDIAFCINRFIKDDKVFGKPKESLMVNGKYDYCNSEVASLYHECLQKI